MTLPDGWYKAIFIASRERPGCGQMRPAGNVRRITLPGRDKRRVFLCREDSCPASAEQLAQDDEGEA